MPPEGRSWRYSRERMAELAADNRLDVREGRRPRLKRYMADVAVDEVPPAEERVDLPVVAIVAEFSRALARRLALSPGELADVEWRDLERLLAEVCGALGFETTLTRSGKDGGFDLELRADGNVYLVEVKHWSAPDLVGPNIVSRFAEVVVTQRAERGLLLSTSGFRRAVLRERLEVTQHRVALGDGRKVIGLCQRYIQHGANIWRPEMSLPELLFEGTS